MNANEISSQLSEIESDSDFADQVDDLISAWVTAQVGLVAIEPILLFMEAHPDWDFGAPGSLVHFAEQFYGRGYEQALVESIKRCPTAQTAWMLNRVINGEKDFEKKRNYINALISAKSNKSIDPAALEQVDDFLTALSRP